MPRTGRPKAELVLSDEERETLTRWSRRRKSSQALALRSRIVLACAAGADNKSVAEQVGCAAGTVGFPASDSEKWDLIKGVIDLCDYYVVIVGGRYGSVDAEKHLSYTEMEFDYAVASKKPVMGFLHGDRGKLIADKLDLDAGLRVNLDKFRGKVEKKMVKYWHEPGDLPGQVALAVMQIRKSHPAEGWIRAGTSPRRREAVATARRAFAGTTRSPRPAHPAAAPRPSWTPAGRHGHTSW